MDKTYIENLIHLSGLQSTYGNFEDNRFSIFMDLNGFDSTYGDCKDNLLYLKPFLDGKK